MLSVWEPAFFMLDSFKICGANTRMDHFSKSFEQNAPFLSGHIPYERRNAAAALQQFTFMVAQRLSVCKAVLVSH